MQTTGRLFDDIAKIANGAVGALGGVREEAEAAIRQRLERALSDMDLVPRDEFDAMAAVAQRARQEQEKLTEAVATLEARIAALEAQQAPKKVSAKKAAAKKVASKPSKTD